MIDFSQYIVHDLTLTMDASIPGFATHPAKELNKDGWNARTLSIYSHAGTHMDAPSHFGVGNASIDQYPASSLMGRAFIVRIEIKHKRQLINVADLGSVARQVKAGDSLLLQTGWSNHRHTADYRNALPRISEELAHWCVENKVCMLGVEPPSVADVNNLPEVTRIHEILLKGDIRIIEGLCGLENIQSQQVTLIALPLKIGGGDGAPARVIALEARPQEEKEQTQSFGQLMSALPPVPLESIDQQIREAIRQKADAVIVLDDDPTGTQTVYDVPVLTTWTKEAILNELHQGTRLFYILTNSRSMPEAKASELAQVIGENIKAAAAVLNKRFIVVSRGDSTLRGHYPAEVKALEKGLDRQDGVHFIIPAFFEGGRFTIDNTHYVKTVNQMIPAAQTPFAADKVFGYQNSDLRQWVAEKTQQEITADTVHSISLEEIRKRSLPYLVRKINQFQAGEVCVVNAAAYSDLKRVALAILLSDIYPVFRTAASFVAALSALPFRSLLTAKELVYKKGKGALIIVGSYVPKSSSQLDYLLRERAGIQAIEIDVAALLDGHFDTPEELANRIDQYLEAEQELVLYTSRKLISSSKKEDNLDIGNTVSAFITKTVKATTVPPCFILAKGGITSSDIATESLFVKRGLVRGQIQAGVPVWELGPETSFPGLPFIIFPGNVGEEDSIYQIVKTLNG